MWNAALVAPKVSFVDPTLGPLTDDLLTPEVRVFQRAKGHRFSSDDVATAFIAFSEHPNPKRALDLGCGLGSVLLLLAWKCREATFVGVEAQAASFELVRRNVARNEEVLGKRVSVHRGDIREIGAEQRWGGPFDLVTGTPPYFPAEASIDAADAQRAFARVEYRGGVEAYVEAASRALAPAGVLVLCGDARTDARVRQSSRMHALRIVKRCDVIPRASRDPLFSIWTLRADSTSTEESTANSTETSTLVLRDHVGATTEDADRLRVFCGFPSARPNAHAAPDLLPNRDL